MGNLSERIYEAFQTTADWDWKEIEELKQRSLELYPLTSEEQLGLQSYKDAFEVRFVYNSNSLEGSTLTLGETALVLEGEFVAGKPGRDHFAARGSADGLLFYKKRLETDAAFSEEMIKDLHERTALDCQPASRGVYRRHAVYIRGSETVPANWEEVPLLMKDLMAAYSASVSPEVYKAAVFHVLFEQIHPFADANGRTGRLLLNYMLEKAGHPPVSIKFDGKEEYLQGLENWQVRFDPHLFLETIRTCLTNELTARIHCIKETRYGMDYLKHREKSGHSWDMNR